MFPAIFPGTGSVTSLLLLKKLELTSPYLCSTFKRETNTTLTNYIMEYRVEQAKKYLQKENYDEVKRGCIAHRI
ncbi:MAG: hypothetical protein ACLTML_09050 [Blautia faecis]